VAGAGRIGGGADGKDAAERRGVGEVKGDFKRGRRKTQGSELHREQRCELGNALGAEAGEFVEKDGGLEVVEERGRRFFANGLPLGVDTLEGLGEGGGGEGEALDGLGGKVEDLKVGQMGGFVEVDEFGRKVGGGDEVGDGRVGVENKTGVKRGVFEVEHDGRLVFESEGKMAGIIL